ncbi:hypothetical protein FUA48_14080 [Flavobacterium alkalisoli]|uniref:Uncharacterized protein n=1 Tax=Flavobacterium alkalisoli TaxID=2602769 RepID=A0A5B9FUI4_9FLAO|nr:hypothetical protein [Flavobacterium alkalisoli]QEE50665.1 hypothetical protein FUA48_14080 [Flavobacterium alkalisoli]
MPVNTNLKYYPSLKNLITLDSIPDSFDFVKTMAADIFEKIFYKDFQSSVSNDGSTAFYNLEIITREQIAFDLLLGLKFVLNRDTDQNDISSFPITIEYNWPIIAHFKSFDIETFSFSLEDFYKLGLTVFNISEIEVVDQAIKNRAVDIPPSLNPVNLFVDDLNTALSGHLSAPISYPVTDNPAQELVRDIEIKYESIASVAVFKTYLLNTDVATTQDNTEAFFKAFVPYDFKTYLREILIPRARVTLEVSASIEFPRNILKPWNDLGTLPDPNPESKAYFDFAKAILYADTDAGVGYNLELAGTLNPRYCEIGDTGLLVQIESLKLDLSKSTNIPEAFNDNRPENFTGVYARAVSVTFPPRWFTQESEITGNTTTSLRLGAYDLLIGTGGFSGIIGLEAVPVGVGTEFQYFNDKFNFIYPVTLYEKNDETNQFFEVNFSNYVDLRAYLATLNQDVPYAFKFPLSLQPVGSSQVLKFTTASEYYSYLASLNENILWKRIGNDNGFKVGFRSFDITFSQSKVISSNISGVLELNKFTYPEGHFLEDSPMQIDIEGHVQEDGGFNLTAKTQQLPITLKDIFTYNLKTVELGRDNSNSPFYLGTSGTLQFEGILRDVLKLGPIEIDRLRIYSDGSMEFDGGSINLAEPIVLPLGPADITVTAIHYGSHQKEVNGVMRKFNYFGFDGGINVDPLGVEIRGDGIKYYYCTDDLPNKPQAYLHIQTLYLDLTIPASTPVAIINGWLSIPEPGTSPEYAGGIKIQLPKAKITGSADMKLAPRYPAFIIDASIEFPAPIPLGTFAIYGFRGLLGYRYVAEKEAVGLVSGVDTWYDYYKVPPRGIHVTKFRGPNQTNNAQDPFSIGAGASLGTSFDNGTVLNIKAMILLSVPSLFMIDGRAAVLSARLGLDNTQDPPFFAFVAIGDNSLEFGFGADFKMPTGSGSILKLYADVQAAFFFNNPSKWYVNIGTRDNPVTAEILQLVTLKSYLMLSGRGIEAGSRGEFDFQRNYAGIIKVHAWAYIEVGGKISFEKPQFGAYLDAGVGAEINVKFVELSASFQILFAVEASQPYLIYGKVRIKIKIKILFVFKFSFDQEVEVLWEKSKNVDRTPINPLINGTNTAIIPQIVKGVNMLSNETFELAYLGSSIPSNLPSQITQHIIPLDTYIDLKTEKALLPGAVGNLIGGVTNPPDKYTDLIPPDKVVKGKELRQVKHQYSLESLVIKSWRPASQGVSAAWVDYHPYKALYPDDQSSAFDNLKIGQFQKSDGRYNTVRLLATTPFSYTEQGEPGWYIPEQYGLTPGTLFCEGEHLSPKCADFLDKPLQQQYYFFDGNQMIYSNEAAFLLLNTTDNDYAEITDHTNVFGFAKSLAFGNKKKLQTILPEPSVYISLKLSSDSQGVRIKYYAPLIDDLALEVQYGNPDPNAINQSEPHTVLLSTSQLNESILYNKPSWRAVTKIVIEPLYPNPVLLNSLQAQIQGINNLNAQIALGLATGTPQSTDSLISELNLINGQQGNISSQGYSFDLDNNLYQADNNTTLLTAWDFGSGHKVKGNPFGFMVSGNVLTIESRHQILGVRLFPEFPTTRYELINDGRKATVLAGDIRDFIVPGEGIKLEIDVFETKCEKDETLCELYDSLLQIYNGCLIDPSQIREEEIPDVAKCIANSRSLIYDFDKQYPQYEVENIYIDQTKDIDTFMADQTLEHYVRAYQALAKIIEGIEQTGGCDCGCDEDYELCKLYDDLMAIYQSCLMDPGVAEESDMTAMTGCMQSYLSTVGDFDSNFPDYELAKKLYYDQLKDINNFIANGSLASYQVAYAAAQEIQNGISIMGNCDCGGDKETTLEDLFNSIEEIYHNCFPDIDNLFDFSVQIGCAQDIIDFLNDFDTANPQYGIIGDLQDYIDLLLDFIVHPDAGSYQNAVGAIGEILDYLNDLGHYAFDKIPDTTLLHQVCWLSLESYEYNLNIPGQAAISQDAQATIDGITKYIQPVWRPDTSYVVQFVLKDTVDNGENSQLYPFTYGFTTGGPVGYFHTHPQSTYGGNQINSNPDAFALTSLRQYIDYERSYPNADGNLLSAKPLFYNDETSQIYLFFAKTYATHFFNTWQTYNGKAPVSGRMKIVIKDPVEGTQIVNPPYLDYDENDITTIHIPQTVEEWRDDLFPPVPFVISQWANLYQANNCIIVGADPIKPASKFISIALKHLKPEKLYTAIVNNLYDSDGNGQFSAVDETREVHKFVFKTSRYASFAEQVNSYLLTDGTGDDSVSREAVFSISKPLTAQQVDMAYKTIVGVANPADSYINQYQHAYDRIFEGILGLEPLDEAVSTEFNFIRNSNDNKVIAVIVRNPEPFNIPRIPISEIMDTLQVMNGSSPDTNYKVVFSKDYAQAIIMHSSQAITAPSLSFKFRYKIWNGYSYEESGNVPPITIDVL